MSNYFAYARVSTRHQGKGVSLAEQKEAIETFAAVRNISIIRWFEEQQTAAKRGRRAFKEMVQLLLKRSADGLIIHKVDRGARNLRDWADIGELIDLGIDVRFAHDDLHLDSRGGRLAADIQAVVAADYVRNLREEVRKGILGRLKQGLYPFPAPFGYRNAGSNRAVVPHPYRTQAVRDLFTLYATGSYSFKMLAEEMQVRGIPNRDLRPMSPQTIQCILRNPFYIGTIRISRTGAEYSGIHQPIIDTGLFLHVQELLVRRRPHQRRRHIFAYRQFIHCSCGRWFTGEIHKGHVYYRCHRCRVSIREEVFEAKLATLLPSGSRQPAIPLAACIRSTWNEVRYTTNGVAQSPTTNATLYLARVTAT